MKRRDWAPLLEQADGLKRGPIAGVRNHRLPDLETLLAIDAAAEAAARQQQAIAGPGVARGAVAVVEATENTLDGCGPQTAGRPTGRENISGQRPPVIGSF